MLLTVTSHGLAPSRVIVGRNALRCRRRVNLRRDARTGNVFFSNGVVVRGREGERIQEVLAGEEAFEEGCGDVALLEVWVVKDASMERDGRLDAFDHELVERTAHAGN